MTIYPGGPQDGIKYVATAPDGSRAAFNDPADADYVGMARFTGLDSADIREAIDPKAASDGSIQGLNFRGSRPVVGTVDIVASSTVDRNNKFQKLKRAMNALRRDGTLDFTPDGGIPSRVYFRLNQPIRRNDEPGWKSTVQFPLMSADPYIYGQAARVSTVGASPWQATITNQGDGRSAPTISVTLASASTVAVSNLTTGETVALNSIDPANLINFVSKFGIGGSGNGQFANPAGVATDASGNVYVSDQNNHRVQKFNSAGVWQQTFGSGYGTGNGQLGFPSGVSVDGSGNVYVVEVLNNRVSKFNSAGVYQAKTTTAMFSPTDCALDSTGTNLFVTDQSSHTVRKFTAATLGAQTTNFGSSGSGNGQFNNPTGIALDSSNQPWVVDRYNSRVQKFSNAATPVYVSQFGTHGFADGQFKTPIGLAIDGSNNVYVSDYVRQDVQKFNSSGVYQTRLGSFGANDGQFNQPAYMDARSTSLWVADYLNNRVQKFSLSGPGAITLTHGTASVTSQTGFNLYNFVDVASTIWWSLAPGDNLIQVVGGGISSFTVNWRDAWL